jgi:hypothetical protein
MIGWFQNMTIGINAAAQSHKSTLLAR